VEQDQKYSPLFLNSTQTTLERTLSLTCVTSIELNSTESHVFSPLSKISVLKMPIHGYLWVFTGAWTAMKAFGWARLPPNAFWNFRGKNNIAQFFYKKATPISGVAFFLKKPVLCIHVK
jgi:hypothetical protein